MKNPLIVSQPALALVTALAACSPGADTQRTNAGTENVIKQSVSAEAPSRLQPTDDGASATKATPSSPAPSAKVIGLEGLGTLRTGQPVPAKGSWAERGAQISGACRTVSSPEYPGVYAIVSDGKVRRITVGGNSDVKLTEGIGVGASEKEVEQSFPGFRESGHEYEFAPAKYLTAPNAESGEPALRFEIGRDRKVRLIHVGTMPYLGYAEGCA